jgi:hypothetical protein
MKLTLIDNQNRNVLAEGRREGFGGGFARLKDKTVEMVMPLSACGDYYAEVVHAEHTGKEWNNVHGFNYKKQDIFDLKNNRAYIVAGILPIRGGGKHAEFNQEFKALEKNAQHIQSFINWFESKFKIGQPTIITKLQDNRFLFSFDLWWTQGTYRISLYKNLCRIAIYFDDTKNPLEYLEKLESKEKYDWNGMKAKVMDMLSGFIPEQKMTKDDNCPHNLGIQNFKWPRPLK